jgi:hypothetical protein
MTAKDQPNDLETLRSIGLPVVIAATSPEILRHQSRFRFSRRFGTHGQAVDR